MAAVLLAGCSRAVSVGPPDAAADAALRCARFTSTLPAELSTVGARRRVSPESALTAAYGDPPVAVRCGVPVPAALTPTSLLVTVDGIDWLPEETTGGWLMTTVGRTANVEIAVPTAQGPAPSVAADLAPSIRANLPLP